MVGGQQSMTSPTVSLPFIDNDHSNVGDKYCPDIKGNKMCPSRMCTGFCAVSLHKQIKRWLLLRKNYITLTLPLKLDMSYKQCYYLMAFRKLALKRRHGFLVFFYLCNSCKEQHFKTHKTLVILGQEGHPIQISFLIAKFHYNSKSASFITKTVTLPNIVVSQLSSKLQPLEPVSNLRFLRNLLRSSNS